MKPISNFFNYFSLIIALGLCLFAANGNAVIIIVNALVTLVCIAICTDATDLLSDYERIHLEGKKNALQKEKIAGKRIFFIIVCAINAISMIFMGLLVANVFPHFYFLSFAVFTLSCFFNILALIGIYRTKFVKHVQ